MIIVEQTWATENAGLETKHSRTGNCKTVMYGKPKLKLKNTRTIKTCTVNM